jgi:hypothetical protein
MRRLILFLFVVALIALAVWFFLIRPQAELVVSGEPTSPVFVDILLPENASSVNQGETLSVLAQAWSPSPLTAVQLWVDGQLSAVEDVESEGQPLKVSWDWEAIGLGIHTLLVTASDAEGEEGQSQTLILNVNAGGFGQISAAGGQTLEDIGGQLGIPVSDLQGANPVLDPQAPLGDGQPVTLPPEAAGSQGSQGGAGGASGPELVIHWQFTPLEPVDQSYCYQSTGGGFWQKIPADPFSFFPGDEWLQTIIPDQQTLNLQLDCWGWQGGALKYLGEGQTSLDFEQIPDELVIVAAGFQAKGLPEMKPMGGGGLTEKQVPPPFALREPETVLECASHYGTNFWANAICEKLMDPQLVKQYYLLVWEWQPKPCTFEPDCPWFDGINGYLIYELDPLAHTETLIKEIPTSGQMAAAIPLPWGGKCYGVRAFLNYEGQIVSDIVSYCPGQPPEPKKVILAPEDWLSTDGDWIVDGCETYLESHYSYPIGSQLLVGTFFINNDDCLWQGDSTAAVKFDLADFGEIGTVIQRATLRVSQTYYEYEVDTEVATGLKPFLCATRIGKAKADWTGLSAGHFIDNKNILTGKEYSPISTGGFSWQAGSFGRDVTTTVLGWVENPVSNNGFILETYVNDLYNQFVLEPDWDQGVCYSAIEADLEILYFEQPN